MILGNNIIKENLTGIILAGGKSRRMGIDKAFIKLKGKSLLQISIELLLPFSSDIIISANTNKHIKTNYRIIKDNIKDLGPIGGIFSALKITNTQLNLIIATDTPYINKKLIEYLILNAVDDKISAIVQPNSHIEPLCAIYPTKILNDIERFINDGNRKLIDLLESLNYNKVTLTGDEDFYYDGLFRNMNRPEDLT